MISGIHHVQITIPKGSEDQARAFYCGVLGLPEIEKPETLRGRGGFWLEISGQQVHIGIEDGIDRNHSKAHIAYQVAELENWKAKLIAAGIEIGASVPISSFQRFEFRDPFGNRIEFIEPA
jgi:catechol 2,3-dioxygenase-like lactoylglutathione lyase family enzyme